MILWRASGNTALWITHEFAILFDKKQLRRVLSPARIRSLPNTLQFSVTTCCRNASFRPKSKLKGKETRRVTGIIRRPLEAAQQQPESLYIPAQTQTHRAIPSSSRSKHPPHQKPNSPRCFFVIKIPIRASSVQMNKRRALLCPAGAKLQRTHNRYRRASVHKGIGPATSAPKFPSKTRAKFIPARARVSPPPALPLARARALSQIGWKSNYPLI